jgi:hypothetical protein
MPNVTRLFKTNSTAPNRETVAIEPNREEIAAYIADMLRSLSHCAKHPDFRALHALLSAAQNEARSLSKGLD